MIDPRTARLVRILTLAAAVAVATACGGTAAGTPATAGNSTGAAPANPPASATIDPGGANQSAAAEPTDDGAATDPGGGPVGGDIGDRSKGSAQGTISGGYSASFDLPFGAPLAQLLAQGAGTAYLPYTDSAKGTLFLTISADNQLLVQYAGPDNVGLTNGATPCDLKLDALDRGQAKGSFTCRGMLLIKGESLGSADMTATFEAHK